jgi:hypothetical protein
MNTVDIKGKGTLEVTDGVLCLRWKPGAYISGAACRAALEAVSTLAASSRLPMLVDLRGATHSASARELFPDASSVSRMAFLGATPGDRVIAMFRPPRQPTGFPVSYFTSTEKAMEWLLQPADGNGTPEGA